MCLPLISGAHIGLPLQINRIILFLMVSNHEHEIDIN